MQAIRHFLFWEMFLNALRSFYVFVLKGSKKVVNSFCTTKLFSNTALHFTAIRQFSEVPKLYFSFYYHLLLSSNLLFLLLSFFQSFHFCTCRVECCVCVIVEGHRNVGVSHDVLQCFWIHAFIGFVGAECMS